MENHKGTNAGENSCHRNHVRLQVDGIRNNTACAALEDPGDGRSIPTFEESYAAKERPQAYVSRSERKND